MIDLAALVVSIATIACYHGVLQLKIRRNPLYTVHAVNTAARAAWVKAIMESGKADVLGVQTLRNSVMASSFMASTAILLLIGALSLTGSGGHSSSLWHALNVSGATTDAVLAWKLVFLVLDFFIAFFCFAMAVRFYNHVGYMISVPAGGAQTPAPVSQAVATAYLNRAGLFYLLGIRSFFYSVPLVFWMFGPTFMVAATVVLVAALFPLDRAPRTRIENVATH
jgi:uncharacterized membrane protein